MVPIRYYMVRVRPRRFFSRGAYYTKAQWIILKRAQRHKKKTGNEMSKGINIRFETIGQLPGLHLFWLYQEKASIKDSIPCPPEHRCKEEEIPLLGLPCLGLDSRNLLSNWGKNCSRRSVTIQLNLVTLPCGYGGGPTFHFVTMERGGKQVNVIPPSISRCVCFAP